MLLIDPIVELSPKDFKGLVVAVSWLSKSEPVLEGPVVVGFFGAGLDGFQSSLGRARRVGGQPGGVDLGSWRHALRRHARLHPLPCEPHYVYDVPLADEHLSRFNKNEAATNQLMHQCQFLF